MMHDILQNLYIYQLEDLIEITVFSLGFYLFSVWLYKDKQKNILAYLYGSSAAIGVSYYYNLATLSSFFLLYWPGLLMLFVLVHQRVLQKNFVTLRNIKPATPPDADWIEEVVRAAFIGVNKNKDIVFIIENTDSLREHVQSEIELNSPIKSQLLDILIDSEAFKDGGGILINNCGNILGLNTTVQSLVSEDIDWHDQALALSSETDALFCSLSQNSRLFDIIGQGTAVYETPADTAIQVIKQYVKQQYKPLSKEKDYHDNNIKKSPPISPAS